MRFVLDASIAITWAMRDEDHPLADLAFLQLQSGSAIVPGIWWYEIRNILVLNERRNRISPDDSTQFLLDLEQLSIDVDFPHNGTQLMDLSRKYKLSIYDAAYLALAMRERLPLATLDKTLEAAALASGVPLLA
ncbi:MAG: type II toxin-antitoxin system VapC family toxin [Terracidiphilus sp.]|jgi:predicted nucleic acid-binding protein